MPAKRFRATGFDGRHNTQLAEVQMPSIGLPIGRAVSSKDVSNLQIRARQRP